MIRQKQERELQDLNINREPLWEYFHSKSPSRTSETSYFDDNRKDILVKETPLKEKEER